MEFVIRRAGESDVPGIMAVMNEAKETMEHSDWFVSDDETFIREHLEGQGYVLIALAEDQTVAGFFVVKYPENEENLGTYLNYSKEKLAQVAIMDSAAVLRSYRGNRLQEKMLKAAEAQLDTKKYHYLMCTIHPENVYSLSNMERNGYIVKKKVQCYGGLTRYILEKEV